MGWAQSSIDELGNETFRKVRQELGITAFGANVLVLQPGVTGRPHYHEEQDELYFVHQGRAVFDLPDDRVRFQAITLETVIDAIHQSGAVELAKKLWARYCDFERVFHLAMAEYTQPTTPTGE